MVRGLPCKMFNLMVLSAGAQTNILAVLHTNKNTVKLAQLARETNMFLARRHLPHHY